MKPEKGLVNGMHPKNVLDCNEWTMIEVYLLVLFVLLKNRNGCGVWTLIQQNVFCHRNARNQRNYRHNQGLDITDEEYAEYMTNFDSDFKIPLEEHPFVIAQQQKFRHEIAKYEMRHCTVCRSRLPTTINLHKPIAEYVCQ